MKRCLLTVVAVLAILLQGLSTAWAVMPVAPMTTAPKHHTATADMQEMPCHQHQQRAQPTPADGCHCNDSQCRAHCAMSGSVAISVQLPRLDSYIAAHFNAPPAAAATAPAYTLHRFRPPITLSS